MNKYDKLKTNVLLFFLGNFGSKLISFILLPYYTSILTTEEYGIVELILTIVGLMWPLFTISISDAVLRFSMDKDRNKADVFKIGTYITLIGYCLSLAFYRFVLFWIPSSFISYLYAYMLMLSVYTLFGVFLRGIEQISTYAWGGIIYSIVFAVSNIYLLSYKESGVYGYLTSYIVAYGLSSVFYALKGKLGKYFKNCNRGKALSLTIRQMILYSFPLIPNNISWWINNSLDRFILTWICGAGINGIYSVAYKIPTIVNMISSCFNCAWQISAVDGLDEIDSYEFYRNVCNKFMLVLMTACGFIIILSKPIAYFLFSEDFFLAWQYIPILVYAVLFSNASSFYGSILSANKLTGMIFISTLAGAIGNLGFNLLLIPSYGAMGAAIATCFGYAVMYIFRIIYVRCKLSMSLQCNKQIINLLLLFLEAFTVNIDIVACGVFMALFILINIKDIIRTTKEFVGTGH